MIEGEDTLHNIFLKVLGLYHKRIFSLLSEVGIYPGQQHLLFVLKGRDGKSQKELAEILNIKPSTITVMINRMEKGKLIERRQDNKDQRVCRVYITEKGKEICRISEERMKLLEKECFGNFSVKDETMLKELLIQLEENLNVANNIE